jgi:hypothetical protein
MLGELVSTHTKPSSTYALSVVLYTLKARWLLHMNLFFQKRIQEGTVHIHLVQFEPFSQRKG